MVKATPTTDNKVIPEIWQRFPFKDGWRKLYTKRDNERKLLITFVQNKCSGNIKPFYCGALASSEAAAAAAAAANEAEWAAFAAHMETLQGIQRKAVFSAAIKLVLLLSRVRRRLQTRRLKMIQIRVMERIGTKAPLIMVNLIDRKIHLKEQVEFEGGKAVIKSESEGLMEQIKVAIVSIVLTCNEFKVPLMNLRIEGHTSFSKKSTDGGEQTSTDRANAVKAYITKTHVPASILHTEGLGSSRPMMKKPNDPLNRRVEIHVMSDMEVKAKRMEAADAA
jgi:outer membrane protein OmpA-like peptidoglycan-associated protein